LKGGIPFFVLDPPAFRAFDLASRLGGLDSAPLFALGLAFLLALDSAPVLALDPAVRVALDLAVLLALDPAGLSGTLVSRWRGLFFRARRRARLERSPP
jgi:hypothetical protein